MKHPVDNDFCQNPNLGFLEEHGWLKHGDYYTRPGKPDGVSASVVRAQDGTLLFHVFTTSTDLEPRSYNFFDLYCQLKHAGNVEAARADLRRQGYGRQTIPLITSKQLDSSSYDLEYLIRNTLVAKQPCIVAGPKKALKTSILIALAVALATGLPFLGRLVVTRSCKVVILSGESGMATLQETARRICESMQVCLADVDNLLWSDWLPRLDNPQHLDALEEMLRETKCEVLIVDPAYLCMPGTDASNLFIQGQLLGSISEVCQRQGVGLILAHHTRKQGKANATYEPPELDDMAWAGFAEFARQWLLIGRREQYEPGTGEHRLWLSIGGSAGHGALYGLDIDEGVGVRHWQAELLSPDDARKEKKADNYRRRILDAASNFPNGETKTVIFMAAKLRLDPAVRTVFDSLVADGQLVPCAVTKNGKPYDAYKLA